MLLPGFIHSLPAAIFRFAGPVTLVTTILCGCSDSQETVTLSKDNVILCFGDSLTRGVGTTEDKSYPSVLAELTGLKVVNAGKPGETSGEGLERLPGVLDKEKPSLVILCHGGNDILQRLDFNQTKKNLVAMVKLCQEKDIKVVMVSVPSALSDAHPMYAQVADETGVPIENQILGDLIRVGKYKSDQVHLNDAGYRKLAEAIFLLLTVEE